MKMYRQSISGVVTAPPSKSYEQRLLAAALLSRGECFVSGCGNSDDVVAARSIVENLGVDLNFENGHLRITPTRKLKAEILNCGESALCARLFTPIAAVFKTAFTITGEGSLLNRPVTESFSVLRQMGCVIESLNDKLPAKFTQTNIKNGQYYVDGSKSSQFISGLILALSVVYGDSMLIVKNPVSINYILMTIDVAKSFGVDIRYSFETKDELKIKIPGNQSFNPGSHSVEGDWSGIANILVAAAINGNLGVKGLSANSIQADRAILKVLDLANVKYYWKDGVLFVEKSEINAFDFNAVDCPDLIPALVILAIFASGTSHISGASRLKFKESSRADVLNTELKKAGITVNVENDILTIKGGQEIKTACLNTHGDHRMAMCFSILELFSVDEIKIEGRECVTKSWPEFFDVLQNIVG
jgi:3-phosphoshikimate 1-carboxyvinyltransferase